MTTVDPFIVRIPRKWGQDPEVAPYVTYLNRHLHDLWLRSGGGSDQVSVNTDAIAVNTADIDALEDFDATLPGVYFKLNASNGPITSGFTVDGQVVVSTGGLDVTGDIDIAGNVAPKTDDTYLLGSATLGWKGLFVAANSGSGSTPRTSFRGVRIYRSLTDTFFGDDNVFPGFYVQKVIAGNSSKIDNTDDVTNLYQGDFTYPTVTINYNTGDGKHWTAEPWRGATGFKMLNGSVSIGEYDVTNQLGGGGLWINARVKNGGTLLQHEPEILYTGTSTGSAIGGAVMVDTGNPWGGDNLTGLTLHRLTDDEYGDITSNTTTEITANRDDGGAWGWTAGQNYEILGDTSDAYFTIRSGTSGMGAGTISKWKIGGAITNINPCDITGQDNDGEISFGEDTVRWAAGYFDSFVTTNFEFRCERDNRGLLLGEVGDDEIYHNGTDLCLIPANDVRIGIVDGDRLYWGEGKDASLWFGGTHFNFQLGADADWILKDSLGTNRFQFSFESAGTNQLDFLAGARARWLDATNANSVACSHDGTDFNFAVAGGTTVQYTFDEPVLLPAFKGVATRVSSVHTADDTERYILGDTTAGSFEIDLPAVSGLDGYEYVIKNIGTGGNSLDIDPNLSEFIGLRAAGVVEPLADDASITIVCDETNSTWRIV
jgi:hypothetical protein